ncbi:hypothetical protein [Flavobacterium psychrophilum]|nr:hypothetical protein [Flavobacterium psychrophilum]GAW90556.1 hypothetical protein FPS14_contig00070-0002 [Flavobacterium psychrophilum]
MKAIHNRIAPSNNIFAVGNYKLKYNFESNSQRGMPLTATTSSW